MSAIRKKVSTRPSCMPPTRRRRTRFGFAFPRGSSSSPSFPPRPGDIARHRLPPRRDADGSLALFSLQQIVKDDGAALSEFEKEVAQVRVGSRAPYTGARSRFSPGIAVRVFFQCARARNGERRSPAASASVVNRRPAASTLGRAGVYRMRTNRHARSNAPRIVAARLARARRRARRRENNTAEHRADLPTLHLFPPHSRLSSTSRPPTTSSRLSSRTSTSTVRRRLTCPVAAPRS